MKKIIYFILIMCVTSLLFADPYNYIPADRAELHKSIKNINDKIILLPKVFLREYDPITLFYPNKKTRISRAEDMPEKFISIKPEIPGEYRWIDKKTLQFKPTIQWAPMTKYTIALKNKILYLYTLMDPPNRTNPRNNSNELLKIKHISLFFANHININALKKALKIEIRDYSGIKNKLTQTLTNKDYTIKQIERNSFKDNYQYKIEFNKTITEGHTLYITLSLSIYNGIKEKVAILKYKTKKKFQIETAGVNTKRYTITPSGIKYTKEQILKGTNNKFYLYFSENLKSSNISKIKKLIRFVPTPENIKYYVNGKIVTVSANFMPNQEYCASIYPSNIIDYTNRKLYYNGISNIYFYFPEKSKSINWSQTKGILERYGYQIVPIKSKGIKSIDLRIYKIDPKNKIFHFFPDAPVKVNEKSKPPLPGEEPKNYSSIINHIKMLDAPIFSNVVNIPDNSSEKTGIDLKPLLKSVLKQDKIPGTYILGYRNLSSDFYRYYIKFQITDLCLTTFEEKNAVEFLVTSINTGKPIKNAEIKLQAVSKNNVQNYYTGRTNKNGLLRINAGTLYEKRSNRIVITKENDILTLDINKPPAVFKNNHWYKNNRYNRNWLTLLSNRPYDFSYDIHRKGFLSTERPIYKPKEKVYIKGYMKNIFHGKIIHPDIKKYRIEIIGPGNKKWKKSVKINDYDAINYVFNDKKKPTGYYNVRIYSEPNNYFYAETDFKVESYKIPKFEVNLFGPNKVAMDKKFKINLIAKYYAGGNVASEHVFWRVNQFPYYYKIKTLKNYIFNSDSRYTRNQYFTSTGGFTKNDKTNNLGSSELYIDPTKESSANSREYVIEGKVTGADGQTVISTKRVKAVSAFNLGIKLDRIIKDTNIIYPKIVCLNHNDTFYSNQKLQVKLFKREWHTYLTETNFSNASPKYVSDEVDIPLTTKTIISKDRPVTTDFKIDKAGIYIIEISGRDKLGRVKSIKLDFFVSGDQKLSWEKTKSNKFNLVTNKNSYEPGEKVKLLIKSPFLKGIALVVLESGKYSDYHMINIKSGKAVYEFLADENDIPYKKVYVLIMKGRSQNFKGYNPNIDLGKPATYAAFKKIKIKNIHHRLKLDIVHSKKTLPGKTENFKIKLKDYKGKPISGEVCLWLVDQAVLALGKEKSIDPLPKFIIDDKTTMKIRDMRNSIVGNILNDEKNGGDGTNKKPSHNQKTKKSIFDNVTVRKNFKTVPYYNPSIIIPDSGEINIKVQMSDNLTNFKIRAIAVTKLDKFGIYKDMIQIRLPLIVQPALPRFIRLGDEFTAGGVARIVEGAAGKGEYEVKSDLLNIKSDTFNDINWKKNIAHKLFFDFSLPKEVSAEKKSVNISLAVSRNSDGAKDAFQIKLPIKPDIYPIKKGVYYDFDKKLVFNTPKIEKYRRNSLKQELIISDKLGILKMSAALQYLIEYPYGCTEQKISKSYVAVALKKLIKDYPFFAQNINIDQSVNETLRYLNQTIDSNGLFSYWPGSKGYVYLTAYVVSFLTEAREAGYYINNRIYRNAIRALKRALRSDYSYFINGGMLFERTEALYALSLAGYSEKSYANKIMGKINYLDFYHIGKLAQAGFINKNLSSSNKKRLIKLLDENMIFGKRYDKKVFMGFNYKTNYWKPEFNINEILTISEIAKALLYAKYDPKRLELVIDDLSRLGDETGWGNTLVNASAFLTLSKYLKTPRNIKKQDFSIIKNNKSENLAIDKKHNVISYSDFNNKIISIKQNTQSDKIFHLFYRFSYIPKIEGYKMPQINNGFVIDRMLTVYDTTTLEAIKNIKIDTSSMKIKLHKQDIIQEKLEVINPEKRHFVAIVSPIPAGFEPMISGLEISEPESKPSKTNSIKPSYINVLDDRVEYFFDFLPEGTFKFYYRYKAITKGKYTYPGAYAEMMYHKTVYGNSNASQVIIK